MFCARSLMLSGIIVCLAGILSGQQPSNPEATAAKKTAAPKEAAKPDSPLDALTHFSATMVGGPLGNIDELNIYRSGNLMRTDMLDGKNYMVTNLDSYDTFVVLPDRCMHDARPALNTFPFTAVHKGNKVERRPMGTETIDDHACQVEEVTITSERGKSLILKLWEATDLNGFPLKVEVHRSMGAPVTITYKNVKIGPPDAALFAYPANCGAPPAPKKAAPKKRAAPGPGKTSKP